MSLIYLFTNIFIQFWPGFEKWKVFLFPFFYLYETYDCHHRCIILASFQLYANKLFLNKMPHVLFVLLQVFVGSTYCCGCAEIL